MNKHCWHINFVSIFNSDRGHAYCPDCGKEPLSYKDCAMSIMLPAQAKIAESMAKDLYKDIMAEPPNTHDDILGNMSPMIPKVY